MMLAAWTNKGQLKGQLKGHHAYPSQTKGNLQGGDNE
jgi:hypothetical protein